MPIQVIQSPISHHTFLVLFLFLLDFYGDKRDLHSFPTRRSSDLGGWHGHDGSSRPRPPRARSGGPCRSEEHTSELQSRGHLVCRLLLEKKNKFVTSILNLLQLYLISTAPSAHAMSSTKVCLYWYY